MIDITMKINEQMRVYKNKEEKKPKISNRQESHVFESDVTMNLHTGTHVDFPKHMIPDGKTSKDYEISQFVGRCYVKDATYLNHRLLKRDLQNINLAAYEFILFKTKNSALETFNPEFIYISEEAANYIATFNLKGVGIDGLGAEREQPGHPTHKILLSHDILIFEGLDLSEVDEGVYELVALPMRFDDVEASPVRAILR
ncbi:MAG: cyclase family protein [Candidatus Delongbacteria bacterium]|nr:cyclase family protein [Candidatus Delongbacteria bacterium]